MAEIFHVTVDTLLFEENALLVDLSALTGEQREIVLRLVECFTREKK
jgi:hypothetical protein